jgi:hypothetical protein
MEVTFSSMYFPCNGDGITDLLIKSIGMKTTGELDICYIALPPVHVT